MPRSPSAPRRALGPLVVVALAAGCADGCGHSEAAADRSRPAQPADAVVAEPPPPPSAELTRDRWCEVVQSSDCFVAVPATTVVVGAQADHPDRAGYDPHARPEEGPPREVSVAAFRIQRQEVPARVFADCVESGACRTDDAATGGEFTAGRPDRAEIPLNGITWDGARRLCGYLGARLPTEDEWEAAARTADGRRYPWGDWAACPLRSRDAVDQRPAVRAHCATAVSILSEALSGVEMTLLAEWLAHQSDDQVRAVCATEDVAPEAVVARARDILANRRTEATREPSKSLGRCEATLTEAGWLRSGHPLDLRGLAGSVAEWTADPWRPSRDPTHEAVAGRHPVKGGSWLDEDPVAWRAAARVGLDGDVRLEDVGVRCAWSAPEDGT